VTKFRNRTEAGRRLAERLRHLRGTNPVVYALPRGGVPVALPIAEALGAPLDLMLVRKIGAPGQPELALGAVVEGDPPQTVVNEDVAALVGVPPDFVTMEAAQLLGEIDRRRRLWLRERPAVSPHGRVAIVVDDGIATGATVRAALLALERAGAARRVVAAPVAARPTAEALRSQCDEAVFLEEPEFLGAVGSFYDDFRQIEDAEVSALLRRAASSAAPARREDGPAR